MELEAEVNKLLDYIKLLKSSGEFQIERRGPPSEGPADEHIGAIIVDATLSSPRHNYRRQVEKRVENLRSSYPQAETTSGFLDLMNSVALEELLMGWEKDSAKKLKQIQVSETAQFFASEDIETYSDLSKWIRNEENRRKLKKRVNGIGNKTADYYGVLAGDPNAVAIDDRISIFLDNAGIATRRYREKRTIVQLAAIPMGYRPLDLDHSIWHYHPERNRTGGEMAIDRRGLKEKYIYAFAKENKSLQPIIEAIGKMNKPQGWDTKTFRHARKGEFVKGCDGQLGPSWKSKFENFKLEGKAHGPFDYWLKTYEEARRRFEDTPEGKQWLEEKESKRGLKEEVSIQLLPEQMAQLEKIASECCVDAPTLAKIWIIEHLR